MEWPHDPDLPGLEELRASEIRIRAKADSRVAGTATEQSPSYAEGVIEHNLEMAGYAWGLHHNVEETQRYLQNGATACGRWLDLQAGDRFQPEVAAHALTLAVGVLGGNSTVQRWLAAADDGGYNSGVTGGPAFYLWGSVLRAIAANDIPQVEHHAHDLAALLEDPSADPIESEVYPGLPGMMLAACRRDGLVEAAQTREQAYIDLYLPGMDRMSRRRSPLPFLDWDAMAVAAFAKNNGVIFPSTMYMPIDAITSWGE